MIIYRQPSNSTLKKYSEQSHKHKHITRNHSSSKTTILLHVLDFFKVKPHNISKKISNFVRFMKTTNKKEGVLQAVERTLTNYLEINNHRKTPERYAILKAVYSIKGHFTLEELGDKMLEEYKFPVSRATLYNTLKLFMELRLVIRHRFQGSTKYEASYEGENHCHQICTMCGKVTEVKAPGIAHAIDDLHLKRFRKDGFTLYIYGICSSCQSAITRKTKNKTNKDKDNE